MTSSNVSSRKKNDFVKTGWNRGTKNRETPLEMRSSKAPNESDNTGPREKVMDSELFRASGKRVLLDLITR